MATYQFSALSDGQAISFNPNADVLNFDQSFVSASWLRVTTEGSATRITVIDGRDVLLLNTTQLQLATSNLTFADGSRLLFGDNSPTQAADNNANTLNGTAGADLLAGFGGADTLNGGLGNDRYVVSTGDVLSDTGGNDTVVSDINWTLGADFENLTLTGTTAVNAQGNNLNNWIQGNDANNSINGRGGDDFLEGFGGNDTFDMSTGGTSSYGRDTIGGGSGTDTVDFGANARSAINANLAFGWIVGGGDAGDGSVSVSDVENLIGGAFDDSLVGSGAANFLYGGAGNDTLSGGEGADRLQGAAGSDSFVFAAAPGGANADLVLDFVSGTDKIHLDAQFMSALGNGGNFAAGDGRFYAAAGAASGHDANDRVIYNTTTGNLYYDADGNGSGAAQLIATLQNHPALAASDIAVDNAAPAGETINGTAGDDSLGGTSGNDTINGLGGNDTIGGNGGADSIVGGDGDDNIAGGFNDNPSGSDTLIGGNGNDTLDGTSQSFGGRNATADFLDGGAGNDYFHIDSGDTVTDSGGIDTIEARDMDWTLAAGFESLRINNDIGEAPQTGIGNALNNEMWLMWGGGRLEGLAGNDTLHAGVHGTTLVGGDGDDLLDGISSSPSVLEGGSGNDTLMGNSGTSTGGAGGDHFNLGGGGTWMDFAAGVDRVRVDGLNLANVGPSGDFAAGDQRFYAAAGATAAHDASDRVIYDTSTGNLYYDADGTGAQGAQLYAHLQGAPSLAATDIYVINGSSGSGGATINGTNGPDSLDGTSGNETLNGFGGDDTIDGAEGDDRLNGDAGNDYLNGTKGADTLDGGAGNDYLDAGYINFGSDGIGAFLIGGDGDDELVSADADTMDGGLGDDHYTLIYDRGQVFLADPGGHDVVTVYSVFNLTLGAGLDDLIVKSWDSPYSSGGTYIGNSEANLIDGSYMFDVDRIEGGAGNDTLIGGYAGHSGLYGGDGADVLTARSSEGDLLDGGAGVDTMSGSAGNDMYYVTAGDVLADAGGIDTVRSAGSWNLGGGFENLELTGTAASNAEGNDLANRVTGNDGNNTINARGGSDTLIGAGGNDYFNMSMGSTTSFGNDSIDGGAGTDTVDFGANARSALVANLAAGTVTGGEASGGGSSTIANIENFIAGAFNDRLTGSSGANLLYGGAGNDTLAGGAGVDRLQGAAGNDTFVFANSGGANADLVLDFASGADKLAMDNAFFTAIGADGNFAAGDARFFAAAGATSGHDASDRIVYNTTTGNLYYDADGSGSGAAQLVATIQGHPAVAATDIAVI